jgi:hypothetical protein
MGPAIDENSLLDLSGHDSPHGNQLVLSGFSFSVSDLKGMVNITYAFVGKSRRIAVSAKPQQ